VIRLKPQQSLPILILEDKVICADQNCAKADVCEILKSVMRLDGAVQNIQKEYKVKLRLKASIIECEHIAAGKIEEKL
jgi:hypothetical protein